MQRRKGAKKDDNRALRLGCARGASAMGVT